MAGVALAARGHLPPEQQAALAQALAQLAEHPDGRGLAQALQRVLAGRRDPQTIAQGLDLNQTDLLVLALTLAAIEDDGVLQALVDGTD